MALDAFAGLSNFQRKFHRYCIETEIDELEYPMYRGFSDLCKELAKTESSEDLKKYNMGAWMLAARHWPRARWAAQKLFEDYGHCLSGYVDVVLWGCGCGLDLLAIYDQALAIDRPQFWTTVRSVTLFDRNGEYMQRAKEIAEVLFPMARVRIVGTVCDWDNDLEVSLLSDVLTHQSAFGFVTRLNVISDALRTCDEPGRLSRAMKNALRRTAEKGAGYFNELFYVVAPGSDRRFMYERIRAFEDQWDAECPIGTPESVDLSSVGTYYSFDCMTNKNTGLQKAICGDDPVVAKLYEYSLQEQDPAIARSWVYLIRELRKRKFGGRYFFEIYRHVLLLDLSITSSKSKNAKDKKAPASQGMAHCLVFAPDAGTEAKAFLILLGKCPKADDRGLCKEKYNLVKSWLRLLAARTSSTEIVDLADKFANAGKGTALKEEYSKLFQLVCLTSWDMEDRQFVEFPREDSSRIKCQPYDLLSMYGVESSAAGGDVLPETLNANQRLVVYGRKRQRLVRGGPGTGKTLTMLHHALMVHKRTHLPVLLVTKTNSLTGNNIRRLCNSYFKMFSSSFVQDDVFVIRTMNMLLCGLARGLLSTEKGDSTCFRIQCQHCLGQHCAHGEDPATEPNDCDECRSREDALGAVGLLKTDSAGELIDPREARMRVLGAACDYCNEYVKEVVKTGGANLSAIDPFIKRGVDLFHVWGGVLVDEAQLIEKDDMKILHQITEHFNPMREFYIFADEEQSLHGDSLVKGTDGKFSVAVPADLFGRWRTLKGNHRVKSRNLLKVYRFLQETMAAKYDVSELLMEDPEDTDTAIAPATIDRVFGVERVDEMPSENEFGSFLVRYARWTGSETTTVVIDDEHDVRSLHDYGAAHSWKMTHLASVRDDGDRRDERRRRKEFKEVEGAVHLTTIDCAQGRTFENVVFVITREANRGNVEEAFTGFTRASRHLYVLDVSPSGWAYGMLKKFGAGGLLVDALEENKGRVS